MLDNLLEPLLKQLQGLRWPPKRRNVVAQEYMVLGVPQAGAAPKLLDTYAQLWALATRVLQSLDPAFEFSSIAVTKNFVASPHVDMGDKDCQYAIALGDFHSGGELCIEASPMDVVLVDTRNRLAKVDGRYPHWVMPYEGERFSLIFYRVTGMACPKDCAVHL